MASAALFHMLGADPLVGRGFVDDEDEAGAPCVVVFSRQFWMTRFGSDRALIGKSLLIDDRACTVIGIVPDIDLPGLGTPSVRLPFGVGLERWRQQGIASNRNQRFLTVFGKLAPGTTLEQARACGFVHHRCATGLFLPEHERGIRCLASVGIDTTALVFAAAVSILAALASGCALVASAVRIAARQSLNQGDRTMTGGSRARRVRDWLMAAEIALAVVLLTGGMLALRSYWSLSHIQLGFAPHHVLTASITPPAQMATGQSRSLFRYDAHPAAEGPLSR